MSTNGREPKIVITITGDPGTGKSTIAHLILKTLRHASVHTNLPEDESADASTPDAAEGPVVRLDPRLHVVIKTRHR